MSRENTKPKVLYGVVIAIVVLSALGVLTALFLPARAVSRVAGLRNQSLANLQRIAAAMLRYEQDHGHLPAAAVTGPDGSTKHSWRIELLPYLGERKLYDQYRLNEPWDSQHNKRLIKQMPAVYQSPGNDSSGMAAYFVPVGPRTLFGNADGPKLSEIQDDRAATIMLADAKREIPWTKPEDIVVDLENDDGLPSLGGLQKLAYLFAFADGTVDCVFNDLDKDELKKMLTIAGGEFVEVPDWRPLSPRPGIQKGEK